MTKSIIKSDPKTFKKCVLTFPDYMRKEPSDKTEKVSLMSIWRGILKAILKSHHNVPCNGDIKHKKVNRNIIDSLANSAKSITRLKRSSACPAMALPRTTMQQQGSSLPRMEDVNG